MPSIRVTIDEPIEVFSVIEDVGPVGAPGPPGPPGPAGPAGPSGNGLRFTEVIGDGVGTTFEVNHGFNTDVTAQVVETAGGALVFPEVSIPDPNYVRVVFARPPAWQQYRVIVTT